MPKIVVWDDELARRKLVNQLKAANKVIDPFLRQFEANEHTVFPDKADGQVRYDFEDIYNTDMDSPEINVNYTLKNLRFIHAQMSANPPTVVPRPASSDNDDRRKADAADRLIRHAIRQYTVPEYVDKLTLNTLLYGFGFIKVVWDSMRGEVSEFDEETGEILMDGDICISVPHPSNIRLDHQAKCWEDVRYLYERIEMSVEEAVFRWPDKEQLIRACAAKKRGDGSNDRNVSEEDMVEFWEYHEKGMPINGMLGRFTVCTEDGQLLEPVRAHPNRFSPPLDSLDKKMKLEAEQAGVEWKRRPPVAHLPYGYLSDIDVPDSVYAKSFVEYEVDLQNALNRLDTVTLDNLEAHGVGRMILPEGSEIADDAISNSPWDVIKITGTQPPHFMQGLQLPPDMTTFRDRLVNGIDEHAGINASMMGQMERETAGFALQYATNQGNLIRRRLFNKYVAVVEWLYKAFVNLVRKHWQEPRIIKTIGKEHAFEARDIKSADVDGGFDFVAEYGNSLSLDPMTRREEIMQMMPMFEKAGIDPKTLMRMLKLNELEGMYDLLELSALRQREIFEEIIESEQYIAPEELQEHAGMLDYAYQYIMSSEFKYLPEEVRELIKTHVREREEMAAAGAEPMQPQAPGPATEGPAMIGQPGIPPIVPPVQ